MDVVWPACLATSNPKHQASPRIEGNESANSESRVICDSEGTTEAEARTINDMETPWRRWGKVSQNSDQRQIFLMSVWERVACRNVGSMREMSDASGIKNNVTWRSRVASSLNAPPIQSWRIDSHSTTKVTSWRAVSSTYERVKLLLPPMRVHPNNRP